MASNINPFNIDGSFPVAGQDNDSQGFRDNFTSIRNNLAIAKSELDELQAKAVLTAPLSGSQLTNEFFNNPLIGPQLRAYSETIVDHSTLSGSLVLDYSAANVHKVTTAGNITVSFKPTGWPAAGLFSELILWISVTNASHTVTVPVVSPGVTKGLNDIAGCDYQTGQLTFDAPGDYVFSFSSQDGGLNILIQDYVRNRVRFRDASFYFNPDVNPTLLIGYNQASVETAKVLETGLDAISTYGSFNSVAIMDLTKNTVKQDLPGSFTPGYSITATRGNIDIGDIRPTESNDFIGYHNSYIMTGNASGGVGVTKTITSSTGSNVVINDTSTISVGMFVTDLTTAGNITGNTRVDTVYTNGNVKLTQAPAVNPTGDSLYFSPPGFKQAATIGFHATGSNSSYGLGGNISVFTRRDGDITYSGVYQNVGFENDQSTKFFGNIMAANVFVPSAKTVGGSAGQISYDSSYLYVCLGSGNWKRISWSAW